MKYIPVKPPKSLAEEKNIIKRNLKIKKIGYNAELQLCRNPYLFTQICCFKE